MGDLRNFIILGSYEKSVDDFEKIFGKEMADRMMLEIFTYGATGERTQEFPASIECCLATIQAKMDMSQERKERTLGKKKNKAQNGSAK